MLVPIPKPEILKSIHSFILEELIPPEFQNDDIIVAINSLSCRQINQVNDLKLKPKFDPIYFWDLLYS